MKHNLLISNRLFSTIFFAVLMLCATNAWGAVYATYSVSDLTQTSLTYEKSGLSSNDQKLNKGERKVEVPCASASGTLYLSGTSAQSTRFASIYGTNGTVLDASRKIAMTDGYGSGISFTADDILTDGGKYYIIFGNVDDSDYKINAFKYTLSSSCTPSCTAPTSVAITGTTSYTEGQTISLTATPTGGSGTASYQWYKGGTASGNKITGATSATFSKASCTTSDAGNYYCEVSTGSTCSTFSSARAVSVSPAPTGTMVYLKPNASWLEKDGSGVDPRFAVYYYGTGGNGWVSMTLEDACVPTYSAEIPDGAYDKCIFCRMNGAAAANEWSNKYNQTGDLTVPTGNAIFYAVPAGWWDTSGDTYWQQAPLGVCVSGTWLRFTGETITLTATCAGATNFQWYKGGTGESNKITGATSATYTKTNCTIDDGGNYYCKAWAVAGQEATSDAMGVKIPYLEYKTRGSGSDNTKVPFVRSSTSNEYAECTVYPGVAWGYEFTVKDGISSYGNTGTKDRGNSTTKWTMSGSTWCKWDTDKEGTYHFYLDFKNSSYEPIELNIEYPPMAQSVGHYLYMEKTAEMEAAGWNNIFYRIGKGKYNDSDGRNYATAQLMTLVPGTDRFYQTTTPDWSANFWAWHIANNCGSQGDGFAIYQTHSSSEYEITQSINFDGDEIENDSTYYVHISSGDATGGDWLNNNCIFRGHSATVGMLQHNLTVGATTHGQIGIKYTHYDESETDVTDYTARNYNGLAHTCIVKITGVPDCGYRIATLTVNGVPFSSGSDLILTENATVAATFEQYNPITYHPNGGTINEVGYPTSYVLGVGATLPTDVTKEGTWDFDGWYDNVGCTGSPITAILTTDCGAKEYWAKWVPGKETPIFTWIYDATVKAGGIYPVSVSSTGDADVTLTILETITGVTGSFTAGNPATGEVTIGAYPSATTYTYQASSPATSTYKAKVETKTVTIERCETAYNLPYGEGYTNAGSSAHPRYFHETTGVGLIAKGNGGSSNEGSDASWTGESWIVKSNKNSSHLLQTYMDNIVKVTFYVMAGATNVTINKLRRSSSYISSDSGGDDALPGATIIYNNNPLNTGLTKNVQEVATVVFTDPLEADEFLMIVFSSSSTLYGAKLSRAEGDEETSVAFSGAATVEKYFGEAPFIQTASQTTTPIKSGGKITYSSTDETVATVNKNTGEVTILSEGRTRIVATLNAFGCFKKSTAEYSLTVKPCNDPACTIAVTSGSAIKCPSASVTLTATAGTGATFQWYKDGVAIPGETNASLSTIEEGDYYAEARKGCLQVSNTITVSSMNAPTAVALHEYYYIRAGRTTPDIPLFQLTNVDTSDPAAFTMNYPAPAGCTYELREDGIVYLVGTPDPSITVTSYDLTVTAHNSCGYADATATMNLRQIATGKIAWVGCGDKGAGPADAIPASQGTGHTLYQYLENYFELVPVNAYWTTNEAQIKDYYSQFDLVLLTDYPDTNVKPDGVSGGKEKSYSNALGCLIDEKPILTFEAFVADCPNWGINSNPKTPSPKQKAITLLCAAHDIFNGTFPTDEKIDVLTSTSGAGNALQGFSALEAPSGTIFIATIEDDAEGSLIVCCERQQVIEARMMIFGLNHDAMGKVNDDGKLIIKQIIDYLLNPRAMADCALVFDDNNNTHVWSDPGNWAPAHNAVPKPFQAVRIEKDCNVDVENAHCSSIRLMKGTVGTETYDAHLTILANGGLTVTDFIKEVHDANFMTTYPISSSDLVIKADETGRNGSLVFGNEEDDLAATVEYYSLGDAAFTSNPIWQYMGIPIIDRPMAINQYYAAWMCSWESVGNVSSNWVWVENEDRIVPFKGYCITQEAKKKYTHIGTLNAPETKNLPLAFFTSVDGDGFNMFANSWVAPIDITKMKISDFNSAAEATIYIYNAGTYAQAVGAGDPSTAGTYTSPGQYNAIPVQAASYLSGSLTKIPTMQGFFVKATKAGTLTLDYDRICFNTTDYTTTAETMRAPKRMSAETSTEELIVPDVMRLDVTSEHWGDRVYILAHSEFSDAFERGWDGSKEEGDPQAPMLAFVQGKSLLAVAAVESADDRFLSFRAGKDTEYTFSFYYEGETIYLYDIVTQQVTEIRTGNTYSFTATNKSPLERFLITTHPPRITTDINNSEWMNGEGVNGVKKFIYEGKIYILSDGIVYDAIGQRVDIGKEVAQ